MAAVTAGPLAWRADGLKAPIVTPEEADLILRRGPVRPQSFIPLTGRCRVSLDEVDRLPEQVAAGRDQHRGRRLGLS